jgi:hypothetical protein
MIIGTLLASSQNVSILHCLRVCIIAVFCFTLFRYKKYAGGNVPSSGGMSNADCPFLVRVTAKDLRIRKGNGTDTAWTGKYVPPGVYTIVEVKAGKGSEAGWGRLKSGAGWIALSYAKRA